MDTDALILELSESPCGDDLRLNLLIWVWRNGYHLHATSGNAGGGVRVQEGDSWRFLNYAMAPLYLSSIDAAWTLVPPGWNWNLDSDGTAVLVFKKGKRFERITVVSKTPARALAIAAVKATELKI